MSQPLVNVRNRPKAEDLEQFSVTKDMGAAACRPRLSFAFQTTLRKSLQEEKKTLMAQVPERRQTDDQRLFSRPPRGRRWFSPSRGSRVRCRGKPIRGMRCVSFVSYQV